MIQSFSKVTSSTSFKDVRTKEMSSTALQWNFNSALRIVVNNFFKLLIRCLSNSSAWIGKDCSVSCVKRGSPCEIAFFLAIERSFKISYVTIILHQKTRV